MAKPAGSACNLDCTYCFYLSKQSLPGGPGGGHMSEEILESFIRDYIESVTADEVVFSWQGGEPTLMGLGFFEKVVALQTKHAKPGQRIVLCKGGDGGFGNAHFKSSTNQAPRHSTPGWPGEEAMRKTAERALGPDSQSPAQVIAYFTRLPPLTTAGTRNPRPTTIIAAIR